MQFAAHRFRVITLALGLIAFSFMDARVASGQDSAQGYQAQTPIGRMAQGLNPQNWKLPSFKLPSLKSIMPGQSEKDMIVKRKDSLVDEVKQSASRSWTRTKDALNPMKLIPAGFRTPSKPAASETPSKGFFGSLFQPSDPTGAEAMSGVNDFLRQNKPLK